MFLLYSLIMTTCMTIDEARHLIEKTATSMQANYGRPVFNEWIIAHLGSGHSEMLGYVGPRQNEIGEKFADDFSSVRASIQDDSHMAGDFDFAPDADGTRFDAYVVLGKDLYLFVNHTEKSMEDIQEDSAWRDAQEPWVAMAEEFRVFPLAV